MEIPRCTQTWIAPEVIGALDVSADDRVLSVAAAGDAALGLAGAAEVAHVASDEADAALFELKRAIAAEMPVEGARCLLGVDAPGRRVFLYHLMRGALPEPARRWWDAREALVRAGVLRAGRVEAALERARGPLRGLLTGGGRRLPERALAVAGRLGLARVGIAAPEGVSVGAALARLRARVGGGGALDAWILEGTWARLDQGPAWLCPDGHTRLRAALGRVSLVGEPAVAWIAAQPVGRFNVLIAGASASPELLGALLAHGRGGARLLRPRWGHEPDLTAPGWRRDPAAERAVAPFALAYEGYEILRRG